MVSRRLSQDIELIEALSAESLFLAAPEDYALQLGTAVQRLGSVVMHLAKRRKALGFNTVLGLGMRSPATLHQIDRIQDWYASHGVHRFSISLSPAAYPQQLAGWLGRRRYLRKPGGAKFYRQTQTVGPVKTSLRVREIGPERAHDWSRVLVTVFPRHRSHLPWAEARIGKAGWRHYIAYAGRTPVAIGAMFVADGAARLLDGVTIKLYRRRGAQAALIARRLADGMEQGCALFTSETTTPNSHQSQVSYRNLMRAGFEVAYVRADYVHGRPHARRV